MAKLKFALIGCGRIGARHAEHIANHGQLVAVCDSNQEKAKNFEHQFDAPCFFDLDSMLEESEIDVISICTPNGLHFEHTMTSLQANHGCDLRKTHGSFGGALRSNDQRIIENEPPIVHCKTKQI